MIARSYGSEFLAMSFLLGTRQPGCGVALACFVPMCRPRRRWYYSRGLWRWRRWRCLAGIWRALRNSRRQEGAPSTYEKRGEILRSAQDDGATLRNRQRRIRRVNRAFARFTRSTGKIAYATRDSRGFFFCSRDKLRIGAFEVFDFAGVEMPDARRDFVNYVVVVGDEEDCAVVFLQRDV